MLKHILNESDDHALEQALLLKEAGGGTVVVVALDFGDVDNTLYAAAAKGADRIVKIPLDDVLPPPAAAAAAIYADAIKGALVFYLVPVGVQAHQPVVGELVGLPGCRVGTALRGRDPRRQRGAGAGHGILKAWPRGCRWLSARRRMRVSTRRKERQ